MADGLPSLRSRAEATVVRDAVAHSVRRLGRLWGRRGPVWPSRYPVHRMTTPCEVRRALEYALHNHRKHAQRASRRPRRDLDGYSTARAFEGFRGRRPTADRALFGCARPGTWLRCEGWKRHGLTRP